MYVLNISRFQGPWYLPKDSRYPTISVMQDTLEISAILKGNFYYWKIAVEQETELLKFNTYFFILIWLVESATKNP